MNIHDAMFQYDSDLRRELGAEVVEEGLAEKALAMAASPFAFLRATFWRWAETVDRMAPELLDAPAVLAVGDIHLENFGTWRDADGRLIWGVNDFDEAAEMPYALDLLRLASSAVLACRQAGSIGAGLPGTADITRLLVDGYAAGLDRPLPHVLDRDLAWLREIVAVPEAERTSFWVKLEKKRKKFEKQPESARPRLWPRYRAAIAASLPPGSDEPVIWYRSAGLGSLGRPRWVAQAEWRGGLVLREAKAVVPSSWTRSPGRGTRSLRCMEVATGRHRAPDPWYRVVDGVAVRRLSPDSRKVNAAKLPGPTFPNEDEDGIGLGHLLQPRTIEAMGSDLAAVHLGTAGQRSDISEHLRRRLRSRLPELTDRAADLVEQDHAAFRGGKA